VDFYPSTTVTHHIITITIMCRITDMEIGPDGYVYVLSSEEDGAVLYKVSKGSKGQQMKIN